MQKITPFLRFDNQAQQAAEFYCSVFPDSKITSNNGMTMGFDIMWLSLAGINGGPMFKPNPSISFSARIVEQDLCKIIWDKLVDGWSVLMEFGEYPRSPAYGRCNDKYGVSRQIMYDNRPDRESQIVPSLMYTGVNAGKAEEAINFYVWLFKNSSIDFLRRYEAGWVDKEGTLNHAEFKLEGQQFIAMDSAMDHKFAFDEGVSLVVNCDGQEEVDFFRNALINNEWSESQCGRCKDKYGVSRQVVPVQLMQALGNPDPSKAQFAMSAMMKMKKIIIEDLYEK